MATIAEKLSLKNPSNDNQPMKKSGQQIELPPLGSSSCYCQIMSQLLKTIIFFTLKMKETGMIL